MADFGFGGFSAKPSNKVEEPTSGPTEISLALPLGWIYVRDNANNDVFLNLDSVVCILRRDADGHTVIMYDNGGYTALNKPISDVLELVFNEVNRCYDSQSIASS